MPACSAPNCTTQDKHGARLFTFPRDPERRKQWTINCQRDHWQPTNNSRLCESHFEELQFEQNRADGWRKLKPNAVPTIFNVPNCPKRVAQKRKLPLQKENIPVQKVSRTDTEHNKYDGDLVCENRTSEIEVPEPASANTLSAVELKIKLLDHEVWMPHKKFSAANQGLSMGRRHVIVGSTHRDHDYLATESNTSEFLISDNGEKPLEDTHSQVLENVKKELCRICGKKGEALMPICETSFKSFRHMTDEMPLSAKIEIHLPLKVEKDDTLPLHICWTCADLLTRWHELYVTCVAADAVLRKTFGVEETVVPLDTSGVFSRSRDKTDLKTTEEMHYDVDYPPALNVNEKYKGICEKCGKSCCGEADDQSEFQEISRNSFIHPSRLCKICYEPFKSFMEQKNHYIMCRQLSTICEICGVEVQHRKDLSRHKNRKHRQKIKIVTKRRKVHKRHMCDKCAKCFHSFCLLKNHMAVHECDRTPKHFCNLCCKTFYNEQGYERHVKMHEEGKLQTTMNIQALLTNENVSLYVCPVCQKTFEDPLSLAIHLTFKKEMKCPVCHKKIFNERRFVLHKCKVYNCQYCNESFNKRFAYENHERIHTGEKPYKCNICDSMFRTARQKVVHEKGHNPDVFKCSYCSRVFKSKSVFHDHLNGHLGHVISCKICDKKFSSRKSVYKHSRKFHSNNKALI